MVLLHVKKSDSDQFIVESSLESDTTSVISLVLEDKTCGFIEDLIKHGPLKEEEKRGLAEGEEEIQCAVAGHRRVIDPNHYRTGWCVPEDLGRRMIETTQAARQLIHKSNADRRIPVGPRQLQDAILLMKGAVNMAYPAYHGLPPWEPSMLILEHEDFRDLLHGEEYFEPNSLLWFAGKEIQRGKVLKFYVKGNENSKIVVKITKFGGGAPVREPAIDAETHKQMIAWHHKKEEEAKKIMAVDDDQYLNSPWANPKNLKNQLHGSHDVKFRPF